MARSPGNKSNTRELLKLVEERASLNREEKKQQDNIVPYLPKDCISNILIKLPIDSIPILRFVCKPWFSIINDSRFIDTHLQRSEIVLLFLMPNPLKLPNTTFSIEEHLIQSKSIFKLSVLREERFFMYFLEMKEDTICEVKELNISCLGKIKASCNGLVLLENKLKKGGLLVINPVTRHYVSLPIGTLFPVHKESYGFSFNKSTKEYKVVHLFEDGGGFIGCEILVLGARSWRPINGPSFGVFEWFGYDPVFAIGALHWIPKIDHNDYIVSMRIDAENFQTTPLPVSIRRYDGLVEIGGFLCLVNHVIPNQMEIWFLKDFNGGFMKQHTITIGCVLDMVPLAGSKNGEVLILRRDEDNSLYAYDIQQEEMIKLEIELEDFSLHGHLLLPHINSLVSWETSRDY